MRICQSPTKFIILSIKRREMKLVVSGFLNLDISKIIEPCCGKEGYNAFFVVVVAAAVVVVIVVVVVVVVVAL